MAKWKDKWHPPGQTPGIIKHGIGMALHTWGGRAAPQLNECTITIASDGSVTARTSTQDLGTGQRTVTALVTAEILGLEPEQITLQFGESPNGSSSGSGGSTTIPSQAPATLRAATAARDDLFAKIGPKLNAKPDNLVIEPGKVVDKASGKSWEWKKACAVLGMEQAKSTGSWTAADADKDENKDVSSFGVGGVQIAEVAVDTETGVVRCTQIVAVQDCGMVVNRLTCESQVAGGVIMGFNYALFEERIMDRVTGRQVNADMEFYKLGGIEDMPKIVVHLHDMPERGVIGIGEPPTISTHAAIGNAIFNAIGVARPADALHTGASVGGIGRERRGEMKNFTYYRPASVEQAVALLDAKWGTSELLAGGTDLLDLQKEYIAQPDKVVSLTNIADLARIRTYKGEIVIGAVAHLADIASDRTVRELFPALATAAGDIGGPQIRNMGTLGGNLCQRNRCWYFRDEHTHCLLKGGDKCFAIDGENRYHAIFTQGHKCVIVNPSTLAPALIALGASADVLGPKGKRTIELTKFFHAPNSAAEREHVLAANEMVLSVTIPDTVAEER